VYDCTRVPKVDDSASVARLKHIHYKDYLEHFDFIYDTFSHEAITKGRFDKFVQGGANKRGTDTLDKRFVQSLDEWRKYLATSIAKHNRSLTDEELNYAVQLTLDRLIFLRFCEDRAVEPYAQLQATVVKGKGDPYQNLMHLFHEADRKYNSGLFDFAKDGITPSMKIDPKVIKTVINQMYYPLCNFEFSVMPVEILGNAYEQFLGKVIRIRPNGSVTVEEKPEVRKAGGVYYTPQYIVDYIVKNTVGKLIEGKAPKDIEKIKIVDPACGSGSFLLGAYEYLLRYHTDWYHTNGTPKGKDNPLTPQGKLTTKKKKEILRNNIYGVDLDANAVEVSKLSLLLKCMEGETEASINTQLGLYHERVLPNLDNNIKDGNSLIDTDFYDTEMDLGYERKIKPFNWQKQFPEVFKQGGFDVVIGNPPYVQSREGQFAEAEKTYLYSNYQTAEYQINTFGLFIEKGLNILKSKHYLGFIIPNYWLSTQYDKKLRRFLFQNNSVNEITNVYNVFDAAVVDTLILLAQKNNEQKKTVTLLNSINRNLKSISDRLNAVYRQDWAFSEHFVTDKKQDDIEISFYKTVNLRTSKTLSNYFYLKFGAKIYEVGKGIPPQNKSDSANRIYESNRREDKSYKPLLKGRHIKRYFLSWENDWIKYGDNLAAPRTLELFEGNRILVPRIISGKVLSAHFTNQPFICNTDVITLKPWEEIDCKFFLAILNSSLCGFHVRSTNINLDRAAFPKINTNTLESFPVPDTKTVSKENYAEVVKHVDLLLALNEELKEAKLPTKQAQIKQRIAHGEERINRLVYELYELTEDEIQIIEDSIHE
ncbi:MAG: N-6 DNA methylase, partial [Bacteroidetes bacterium]|nr:N-6 DNA methylase [Bacteroidota bacterium]